MSNKNRVNPDHYKVAGRDPQGENLNPERNRQMFGREKARQRAKHPANFIPGAAPVGEIPGPKATSRRSKPVGVQASAKHGVKSTSEKQGSTRSPKKASGRTGAKSTRTTGATSRSR